ncbi:hypothetical protein JCM30237_23530 [Halolamina litorea]|uniref:Nucleic acid-binding protein n=1 Tax=Halolamina litorea TaxID=1515593 RepID=A0ABD6BTU8_9EURY|nr:hypothetical protein [Halolamina litorea]
MAVLIADTSGVVSLAVAAETDPDPLSLTLDRYDVFLPETVVGELRDIASYDDGHGAAARAVLDRANYTVRAVDLDAEFPLDDGENAAVTLANETDAELLLCDEFNSLGLVHASLADTRLVTTPTLLSVLSRTGGLSAGDAEGVLDEISAARSWEANSYVARARSLLER